MPDYTIYIKTMGIITQDGPTQPWSSSGGTGQNQTSAWQGGGGTSEPPSDSPLTTFTPAAIVGKATASMAGIGPIAAVVVAAATVVVKAGFKVFETALDFHDINTGDPALTIRYGNLRNTANGIFSPISSHLQEIRYRNIENVENDRRRKQLELLGDSVINSWAARGV